MRYKVTHTTTYSYTETVPIGHNKAYLTPRDSPQQLCRYHRLLIKPSPATCDKRTDYFGNPLSYFSIREGHSRLSVTAISKVEVRPAPVRDAAQSPSWESVAKSLPLDLSPRGLEAFQFVFDSPHIDRSTELAEYARASFHPGRPILEAALDLTTRVHHDFKYDATATSIDTPLSTIFQHRRGVCQDLAHVEVGMLRSLGLAARYVSGYLLTRPPPGRPRLVGADASHAWLSVYCGKLGWVDMDPTNNTVPSLEHITVAWGRDYSDVCPIMGLFVGGGRHTMAVSVDVAPLL